MNVNPTLSKPETVFPFRRRQLFHAAVVIILGMLMVLAGIKLFRPGDDVPVLPASTDPPARSASPSGRAPVIVPQLSTGEFDVVLDMEMFSEEQPVFVFSFGLLEGKGLCLTRNAKQCEQLLDFSSGTLSEVTLFLPRDAELLGILQSLTVQGQSGSGGLGGWHYTPADQLDGFPAAPQDAH